MRTLKRLLFFVFQASVRSILCEASDTPSFPDEVEDLRVAHMVSLIREGFPFEINTWHGGVKAQVAKQWKGGHGPQGLGAGSGDHGQTSNTDGHSRVGDHGVTLDVQNLVRCLADELYARAGPLLGTLKTHITGEMLSLKEEVLAAPRMSSQGSMPDQAGGTVVYLHFLSFGLHGLKYLI